MKSNPNKHLKAVLSQLGLLDEQTEVSNALVTKAAQWACGKSDFSFEDNQIVALRPVLETLKGKTSNHWFQPNELSLTLDFFPKSAPPDADSIKKRISEIEKVAASAGDNLLTALHVHTASLAVSKDIDDLPLFDFIKTTAAIAHCLENGNGQLHLAGGSISGIQSYLYDIVSKRAGKLLKGRSFYLQLLSDSLAERFLEWFELSDDHIVYSSGGGFYILMPANDNVKNRFEDFKSEVIKKIYKWHGINLSCEFAISGAFTEKTDVPKIWDDLLQNLNTAKNQRLSHNSALLKDLIFPIEQGGSTLRDEITNEEISDPSEIDFIGSGVDRIAVTKFTKKQVEVLGKNLKSAKFWAIKQPGETVAGDWFTDPLGYQHRLFAERPNGMSFKVLNAIEVQAPFVFYGGNETPRFNEENIKFSDSIETEVGHPITFDAIAHADEGKTLNRLGILRMDVDNLGKIFSDDIGSRPSFARYAAVSRSLDWFFKGYLNTIHAEICPSSGERFSERTIIIYSGGDDLFIVGRWLEVLEMARSIQTNFEKWSGGNLTISGGLAILPDKFPVMQGAKLAGEKEKTAKRYLLCEQKLKNAVCFFDNAIHWEKEMKVVEELKKTLERWLKVGLDNSILKKIDQHAVSRKEQEKHGGSPRWIWNMVYDFGRVAQKRGIESIAHEIRDVAKKATFEDFQFNEKKRAVPFLYLLQTAARWVELETRTIKKDKNT